MYLFRDQNFVEIPINCKICLKSIVFKITADEYKTITSFPIKRESVHGSPKHRLTVYINKHLDIENFELEDNIDQDAPETPLYDQEVTKQVLRNIDLSDEEINLYLLIQGRDAVSLGELALLANIPKEQTNTMAARFVQKGLFREIPGATPHFTALPPYAALVSQLRTFHSYISDLKKNAPVELNESFARLESSAEGVKNLREYTDFMLDLKQKTLSDIMAQKKKFDNTSAVLQEISGLGNFVANLEGEAKSIMNDQISELTKHFDDIGQRISQSMDHQIQDLTSQFDNINSQITSIVQKQIDEFMKNFEKMKSRVSQNLAKLRLGVLQKAVDQVIEASFSEWLNLINESLRNQLGQIEKASKDGLVKTKIGLNRQLNEIQKVQNDGIKNTTDKFNERLISNLKNSINKTVGNIKGITATTAASGDEIKQLFSDISKNFSKAVTMAEEKLGGMSESVFKSFDGLRGTFSNRIIEALNQILNDILQRLELNERATKQFWEQAIAGGAGGASLTMQDIWFVRSIEGAKAHVNDQVAKAKMRVLIVAPEITDVNLESVKSVKKHVNIRIATSIDLAKPDHIALLDELNRMENVSLRNRRLQNLWGINRDYEEVILCVLSKVNVKGMMKTEIAGIGSIIQEHIKIFVPILEDAWMGSQKDIISPTKYSAPSQKTTTSPNAPKISTPTYTPQKPTLQVSQPSPAAPTNVLKPVELEKKQKRSLFKPKIKVPEAVIATGPQGAVSTEGGTLSNQFNDLSNSLSSITGAQIAKKLEVIRDTIETKKGFSGVLQPISLAISKIKFENNILNSDEISELENKIGFWRKKLNI